MVELIKTMRLSQDPDHPHCRICGAGSLGMFSWSSAQKNEHDLLSYPYKLLKKLRKGSLFKCKSYNHYWYLDEEKLFMYSMPQDRLSLVEQWNSQPIVLTDSQIQILKDIGHTPPDIYGNGKQYKETPCKVTTLDGEIFNFAIITQQELAPFHEERNYRLASDIQSIEPSPFAFSLKVRIATANAKEVQMGFSPTVVKKPDGQQIVLHGVHNFYDKMDCSASDIDVVKNWSLYNNSPPFYNQRTQNTYFIADS